MITAILCAAYVLGFWLSYSMLRIEHVAEGQVYTNINRILTVALSLLSFGMVVIILANAWFKMVAKTGYWDRPVKIKSE